MCTVSYVGDYGRTYIPQKYPWTDLPLASPPSRAEFDALKKEIEELKKLLKAAKKYDDATGQHECEMDEKVEFIRKLADLVGVDLEDVFPQS